MAKAKAKTTKQAAKAGANKGGKTAAKKAAPKKAAAKKAAPKTKPAAAKAKPAAAKAKPAPKAKAKPAPKAKVAKVAKVAKAKHTVDEPKAGGGGLVAKARAATQALVARAKAATEAIVAKVKRDAPSPSNDHRNTTPGMEPFQLSETSPGKYSLLLTTFDAAAPAFASIGLDAGGYAWEGVAKHIVATDVAALGDRINFDPEASMFCAYGDDRAGLEDLGKRLSSLYHDLPRLTDLVKQIGADGFDD